jgi:hypothetical protein
MTVSFQISTELEQQLRRDLADLDAAAKEAFLVSLYRQGKLSHYELAQALGLDRFETEDVLYRHNVTEDLGTPEDFLADLKTLDDLFARER